MRWENILKEFLKVKVVCEKRDSIISQCIVYYISLKIWKLCLKMWIALMRIKFFDNLKNTCQYWNYFWDKNEWRGSRKILFYDLVIFLIYSWQLKSFFYAQQRKICISPMAKGISINQTYLNPTIAFVLYFGCQTFWMFIIPRCV